MNPQILGWIQIAGAAAAIWFTEVWSNTNDVTIAITILAALFAIVGIHHLGEKKHK